MAINFTTNIEQYTTTSARTRTTSFTQYASKKQLEQANIFEAEALAFVLSLKNTFSFAVHTDKQYVAVTMYYASTKSYAFLVVDVHNKQVAQVESIKQAKTEILALVNAKA